VLRDAYGADWSDAEIDDYLYRIIVAARLARPEAEVGAAAALVATTTPQPPPSATTAAAQRAAMKLSPPLDAAAAAQPGKLEGAIGPWQARSALEDVLGGWLRCLQEECGSGAFGRRRATGGSGRACGS